MLQMQPAAVGQQGTACAVHRAAPACGVSGQGWAGVQGIVFTRSTSRIDSTGRMQSTWPPERR